MRLIELRKFLPGRNDFKSADEIVRLINETVSHGSRKQIEHAETLLIFQTSRQQTWLVGTNQRLYNVLDDLNNGFTKVQWILPKGQLVKNGRIDVKVATRTKTDETGLLDIGERQGSMFSKRLFDERDLVEKIQDMILRKMSKYTYTST
jgi:hypothetical protein